MSSADIDVRHVRYMVSGPLELSDEQFSVHYASALDAALCDPTSEFVIGSAPRGADKMALDFLLHQRGILAHRVTVHVYLPLPSSHRPAKQRRQLEEREAIFNAYRARGVHVCSADAVTGMPYTSHEARDAAMTRASDCDILWLRTEEETKALLGDKYREGRVSGTQANALRRAKQQQELTKV